MISERGKLCTRSDRETPLLYPGEMERKGRRGRDLCDHK